MLGPTFEEAVSHLIANLGGFIPYKSCPLKLYQISTKFRDEMRSKFGLIRSREFIMKDLYTFDISVQSAEETYEEVRHVYDKIFTRLKVPYVSVQGDTGVIGGKISHEYHFISDIGQDELVICENCGHGSNKELAAEDNVDICPKCSSAQLRKSKGIEVGHTFLLGDKYSKIFGAKFMQVKLAYFGVLSLCQIYLESFFNLHFSDQLPFQNWPRDAHQLQIIKEP